MHRQTMSSEQTITSEIITAAMIVIGDEILSGRTRDTNAAHLASVMTAIGVDLVEVRFVADDEDAIIEAVNTLRARNTYVFTSGGIGPTHDDITADSVAKAFGLPCDHDERALEVLATHYEAKGVEFTDARKRMARIPEGAGLIDNPISKAPGFLIGNVHVMAGVPRIFEAMLDNVAGTLRTGRKLSSKTVKCGYGEGTIGIPLGKVQEDNPETIIGSYPKFEGEKFSTDIVVRGAEEAAIDKAVKDVEAMLVGLAGS